MSIEIAVCIWRENLPGTTIGGTIKKIRSIRKIVVVAMTGAMAMTMTGATGMTARI
jgi:hypothetical protein